jgi:hypothetical protein
MSSTTRSTKRQRLAAAALSLPLALSLTGTAFAAGADARPLSASEVAAGAAAAAKPEPKNEPKAESKAESKAEVKSAPAAAKPVEPAAKVAPAKVAPAKVAPAKVAPASSSASDKHGTATSGPLTKPQPLSKGDKNGTGANPGESCSHAYCSTRDGSASQNGKGDGAATGKPCAGCVGKADNKNPKGQAPNGTDRNAGYECDRNQGVGQTNPAHTGCSPAATSPTTGPTKKPTKAPTAKPTKAPKAKPTKAPGAPGTATITVVADCRTVVVTSSKDISNVVVTFTDGTSQKFDGLSGTRWTRTFSKDVRSATAKSATTRVTGVATGCGVLPVGSPSPAPTCPDGSAMPPGGAKKCASDKGVSDNAKDKVTICHATGSATNPYVVITPSKQGVLNGHVGHQDGRDIIPPFSYVENGVTKQFPGQNWNATTQELFHRGCTAGTTTPPGNPVNPVGLTCPDGTSMPGNNPKNCPTAPPVCPAVPVMGPVMAGCETPIGGQPPAQPGSNPIGLPTPIDKPGNGPKPGQGPAPVGGGTPIAGQSPEQPARGPVPAGPPTGLPPKVVGQGTVTPISGAVAAPAQARVTPSALPFTGTDALLLVELGALLLLVGGGVLVVARRERSARAA